MLRDGGKSDLPRINVDGEVSDQTDVNVRVACPEHMWRGGGTNGCRYMRSDDRGIGVREVICSQMQCGYGVKNKTDIVNGVMSGKIST